jgi:hypothetical protein
MRSSRDSLLEGGGFEPSVRLQKRDEHSATNWRSERDLNSRSPERWFADSPLEGNGFEPLVPQREGTGLFRDHLDRPPSGELAAIEALVTHTDPAGMKSHR